MSYVQQDSFDNPSAAELQSLRGKWGWLLLLGIVLVIVGVLAMNAPFLTTLAGVSVFAVLLLIAAGTEFASAIWAARWGGFFLHLVAGLLYLIVGMFMFEHPLLGAAGLVLVLAASFLAKGLLSIIVALSRRFHAWPWVLLNGVVSLILGIFIWRHWPGDSLWFLAIFIGIEIIFTGWTWIMLALAARSIPQTPATAPPA